ncbi:hypothetical protein PR002_g32696 [Phytophthora rubi]|uniref:Uncharacterized protein n=1 Tax=Phytophthora rubi TaxID=129364 RepID=A0A6A3GEI7_9STRA|nr:hypothetical protein PR002_g32696 [Phytophthora rubi]
MRKYPDAETKAMAGDVTSAFRNVSIHSHSVHHFAGLIVIENAYVIEHIVIVEEARRVVPVSVAAETNATAPPMTAYSLG